MAKFSNQILFSTTKSFKYFLRIYQIRASVRARPGKLADRGHPPPMREKISDQGVILIERASARWRTGCRDPKRSGLFERNFKTERLKTGDKTGRTSSGFRSLDPPDYCPRG